MAELVGPCAMPPVELLPGPLLGLGDVFELLDALELPLDRESVGLGARLLGVGELLEREVPLHLVVLSKGLLDLLTQRVAVVVTVNVEQRILLDDFLARGLQGEEHLGRVCGLAVEGLAGGVAAL